MLGAAFTATSKFPTCPKSGGQDLTDNDTQSICHSLDEKCNVRGGQSDPTLSAC